MKNTIAAMILAAGVIGCAHGQVPPNPTVYLCPATTGTAYTPLNQSSPVTTLSYTDATPPAGQQCYVAQSVAGSQVSVPSNTAGPLNVTTGKIVLISWTAPATGPAPTGYVISRATAIASTLGAPTLGTATEAKAVMPDIPAHLVVYRGMITATNTIYESDPSAPLGAVATVKK